MTLGTIEFGIAACKRHLDVTQSWATEIEFFLVQYLLVRICAEFEARIPLIIERRCLRSPDVQLSHFAIKSVRYVTKRFSIQDIGTVLKRFDKSYHKAFNDAVVAGNCHVAWDNIYNNRHAVAHGAGIQMTFNDLTMAYKDSLPVLKVLISALELTPEETMDLS